LATAHENHPQENPFHGFDESVARLLGADMRLIYGMAAPIVMIVGLIIILALSPATWLVVAIVALEIAALGLVVAGLMGMLNEDDQGESLG
jgi:chromate transport protein ChrA